jgi:hypothetical protein
MQAGSGAVGADCIKFKNRMANRPRLAICGPNFCLTNIEIVRPLVRIRCFP